MLSVSLHLEMGRLLYAASHIHGGHMNLTTKTKIPELIGIWLGASVTIFL